MLAVSLAILLRLVLRRDRHADDVVAFIEVHPANAISRAAHRTNVVFCEADRHAFMRSQEDDLLAVSQSRGHQFIAFINADGDNATRHDVREIRQRRLLDGALACGEEDVLALLFQIAHVQDGAHGLAGLQRN